ncbi:Crp/Fnr family transcriptional regulator [Pararhodonellum marinum]|uniref:Crp/Fnr family transcriptional regulator n=1 Tax=Pararhodonellum marinum TaxID=2755358 RepID=UPI00188EE819|nr:Crp/Fnr family transcriptional regulator [Pararhodonellum marinum]
MEQLKNYFNKLVKLTDQEWADFQACLIKETHAKKAYLLEEGQKCDFIAFIEAGTFRFYHILDGEEIVTAFFFPGDFVTNYRSFLTDNPSDHHIQALQDAIIYKIHKKDLHALYDRYQSIERLGRLIAENLYLTITKRLDSFQHTSPEERYQELINRNSKLLQEVPQYMVASYIGVKPETLSRIRARK